MKPYKFLILASAASLAFSVTSASAGTILPGFSDSSLAANDDGSTGFITFSTNPFSGDTPLLLSGESLNFFGTARTGAYLNNNGNMTFTGPMGIYTPFPIITTGTAMIAPFFGDVDTRGSGSALMTYGFGTFAGHRAFGQTWDGVGVGYYGAHVDKLNQFQTLLVERFDTGVGNFDIYFNYDQIQWETGDASYGSGGLGGYPARAGYSNGIATAYELPGAGETLAYLDGGPHALVSHSNVGVPGRYVFEVRSGAVTHPPIDDVPDAGSTLMLLGLALAGLGAARQRFS